MSKKNSSANRVSPLEVGRIALLAGASIFSSTILSHSALAQTDATAQATGDARDADIVITAQRRAQRLQDVGIAVAAFEGDALKELGLSRSTDIAQITPGVYASGSYGGQTQQFTIRGVTQSAYADFLEVPVAVYIDDVYIPTQQGHMLSLFDIDRVEVLKGPQGTLFGRNATGGLVHTVIAQPDASAFSGYADLTYARFNEVKAEGAINVPLSSTAALRVSGYYSRIDDYWKNRYPEGLSAGAPGNFGPALSPCCENLGGSRTYAGRAQFKWEPIDDLSIRLGLSGTKSRASVAPYTSVATIGTYNTAGGYVQNDRASSTETRLAIGPDGNNLPTVGIPFSLFSFPGNGTRAPGADWFGYVPLDAKDLELSSDYAIQDRNRASVWMATGHIDYKLGEVDLSSITAYQEHKKSFLLDADGGPVNFLAVGADAQTSAFSQEVRLSGGEDAFRWTGGAYYLDLRTHFHSGLMGARGSILAAAFGRAADGIQLSPVGDLKTQSISAFGQVEIGLAEQWKVILGGRIIREHQEFASTGNAYASTDDYELQDDVVLFPFTTPYSNERTKTLWAGKAQLEFRPSHDMLIYAGVNRGVKGGNYNAKGFGVAISDPDIPYKAETLIAYEAGFKYGDRAFSLNAAAFYYDYQDFQAFLFTNGAGLVKNQDSTIYGFDADLGVQLTNALRATVGASYSHAEIENYEVSPGVFRTVRPPFAPRAQATATVTYTVPAPVAGGELSFNALGNYASGFYHNLRNFRGNWFKGRTIFNLSAAWKQEPTGLSLTAYVNNLFDKRYGQIGFDNTTLCGCTLESYGPPRTYGLTIGYRF
ncbi:TonB-dependent receptor [Sphingobium estronivorans]|uniref:TonB-dependent receptor n=1 Tax=Sphingobium estronivorans TaxID=1577690 RepID=UPI0013C31693|nr:TonB-dependent receptor [Sphingobium estronivorans]